MKLNESGDNSSSTMLPLSSFMNSSVILRSFGTGSSGKLNIAYWSFMWILTNDSSESSELFRSSPNTDFEHSGAFITPKSLPAYLPLNAVSCSTFFGFSNVLSLFENLKESFLSPPQPIKLLKVLQNSNLFSVLSRLWKAKLGCLSLYDTLHFPKLSYFFGGLPSPSCSMSLSYFFGELPSPSFSMSLSYFFGGLPSPSFSMSLSYFFGELPSPSFSKSSSYFFGGLPSSSFSMSSSKLLLKRVSIVLRSSLGKHDFIKVTSFSIFSCNGLLLIFKPLSAWSSCMSTDLLSWLTVELSEYFLNDSSSTGFSMCLTNKCFQSNLVLLLSTNLWTKFDK